MTKIQIIAVLIALAALSYYGWDKYQDGRKTEQATQKTAVIEGLKDNAKIWKDVQHENRNLSHDDLIRAGDRLGILRPDSVR